ncbi:MAG TPA: hypothetical protein ENK52_03540 [Saprospiraceae bacterium]|nr:hypothetical protein [Saprospiraceae bacterium]
MRKLLKSCSLLFLVFYFSISIQAQDQYVQSIGLRAGPYSGLSYKRFITTAGTIEGIAGFNFTNGRVFTVTGLYEHHFFVNYHLNWYAGGGLSLAAKKGNFRTIVEAIIGIEYIFKKPPLNFSLDYKPNFHLFSWNYYINEFAMTIRYIF